MHEAGTYHIFFIDMIAGNCIENQTVMNGSQGYDCGKSSIVSGLFLVSSGWILSLFPGFGEEGRYNFQCRNQCIQLLRRKFFHDGIHHFAVEGRVIFIGSQAFFGGDHIDHSHIIHAFFPLEIALVGQGLDRYGQGPNCNAQTLGYGTHRAVLPAGDHRFNDMELTHGEIGKFVAAGESPILQLKDCIEGIDQECVDFLALHAGVPPCADGSELVF